MSKNTLIILILIAIILLWAAETLNMRKSKRLLGGAVDIGLHLLG